jgi:ferric-chelate reductase
LSESILAILQLGEWQHRGISNVAGVVALLAGIAMWLTSLPYVRARFFNTFYSMHHLYLVFFAFYAFHVDYNHIGEVMGSVFLFSIDRFLRLVQSRRRVYGVSARVLSSGVIELKIPKRPGIKKSMPKSN